MFGDLFDEHEAPVVYGCAPKPAQYVDGGKVEAPPPGRGETGFSGIKNQGATCYLNSLIQTLLLTPELREELFRLGPDELGKLEDAKKPNAKVRKIPIQLQLLLARLLLLDQYACGTEGLTESFGWVDSEQLQQHDVQELSRILFCAIEDSLVGTSGHDIIKKLYRGIAANTITCLNCGKVSENVEDFLDLNIAIADKSNLTSVLRDMFVETELMNGKNQYRCEKCSQLVDARKGAMVKTLPPILTVSLLRFSFDYNTLRRFKETKKFEFPLKLDMRPYCRKSSSRTECYEYDLYSVIIHSGSAHGGHYHAYIRDVDGLGKVPPDYDPTPPLPAQSSASPEKTASSMADYIEDPVDMLAYVLGKLGGEAVPITKLGDGFRDESGTSWGKQYKRKYGTMTKFLQYHYETFSVDTRTKTVSFRSSGKGDHSRFLSTRSSDHHPQVNGSGDAQIGSNYACNEAVSGCRDNFVTDLNEYEIEFANEVINGGLQNGDDHMQSVLNCSTDSENHPLCNIWFDFNDSHVKPITTRDIETQYEGRESAYMLFYRRKDLKRPLESLGDAVSGIPDHIKCTINQENCHLDDLRTEYDFLLNLVSVQIYFPIMFSVQDSLVKFASHGSDDVTTSGIPYSIDRRKKIAEFMEELKVLCKNRHEGKNAPEFGMVQCHVIRELEHGGVHVYDRVDQSRETVVDDSVLKNGLSLLYWSGDTLQGVRLTPGEGFEPLVLNIACIITGSDSVSVNFKGIASSDVTLRSLRDHFLKKLSPPDGMENKISKRDKKSNLVEFTSDDLAQTLGEVKSGCEMDLTLEISMPDSVCEQNPSDIDISLSLGEVLKKRLSEQGYFGRADDVFKLTSVYGETVTSTSVSVADLKSLMLRWLLPDYKTVCEVDLLHLYLDQGDDALGGSKLRLHESQALLDVGLTAKSVSVRIEVGPPPEDFECDVIVYVQKGSKLKLPVTKNLTVPEVLNKKHTVSLFLNNFVAKLALGNEPWHLRCLKSDREVGDVITSVNIAIEKSVIVHGCSLLLCPGGIPSDGVIRIPIWYYPRPFTLADVLETAEQQKLSLWQQSFIPDKDLCREMAGHVEIEKEATLFDLEQKIVRLQPIIEKHMETVEDICIRSISQGLPTRFHLQETSTVKRLRLGPGAPLAVQVSTAVPKSNLVSLRLMFHIRGTRQYSNPCEYLWDASLPPSQMPGELATLLGIGIKEILLARQSSETWHWEVIRHRETDAKAKDTKKTAGKKNSKQKKGQAKTKTKKGAGSKSPLQGNAGTLKDGDVIRVKNIALKTPPDQEGGPEISDFKSEEDLVAFKRSQDAQSKDAGRGNTEDGADGESASSSGAKVTVANSKARKEETLRIHVDKF